MASDKISAARDKRLYATRMAAHISIMGRQTGVSVKEIPWEVMPTLPEWCLAESDALQKLQLNCGALFLAPNIKTSIDGVLLRNLRDVLGEDVFRYVRQSAEGYRTLTAPLSLNQDIEAQVMAYGSAVLLALLHDEQVTRLFTRILGQPACVVSPDVSARICTDAATLSESGPCVYVKDHEAQQEVA